METFTKPRFLSLLPENTLEGALKSCHLQLTFSVHALSVIVSKCPAIFASRSYCRSHSQKLLFEQ